MFKLPDGTEVDCTLVQARRVWEVCKLHSHHTYDISVLGDVIVITDPKRPCFTGKDVSLTLVTMPYLVMPDGQVFNANPRFQEPPLPMASEKPPEVSEFHRGVISAIETVWTSKFSTAPWTREVQDVLARASAEELRSLLELIARADAVSADAMEALERLKPPQPNRKIQTPTPYADGFRHGKISAIRAVWQHRFSHVISEKQVDTLLRACRRDVTSVDDLLRHLSTPGRSVEAILAEMRKLEEGNTAGGK